MKKNVLLVALALSFGFLTSCKRDFSCTCSYEEFHDDHWDAKSISYPLTDLSKKDANTACDAHVTTLSAPDDHRNVDCTVNK
jgi:hypothetical protein